MHSYIFYDPLWGSDTPENRRRTALKMRDRVLNLLRSDHDMRQRLARLTGLSVNRVFTILQGQSGMVEAVAYSKHLRDALEFMELELSAAMAEEAEASRKQVDKMIKQVDEMMMRTLFINRLKGSGGVIIAGLVDGCGHPLLDDADDDDDEEEEEEDDDPPVKKGKKRLSSAGD